MSIDYAELARKQGPLEHLERCVCTMGPEGFVVDHDCGREIAKRRNREELELAKLKVELSADQSVVKIISTSWVRVSQQHASEIIQDIIDKDTVKGQLAARIEQHSDWIEHGKGMVEVEISTQNHRVIHRYV